MGETAVEGRDEPGGAGERGGGDGHDGQTAPPKAPGPERSGIRPRPGGRTVRRAALAALVALAVGGGAAAGWYGYTGGGGSGGAAAAGLPPATDTVTRQSLADTQNADGELGFGPTSTLSGKLSGTLTELPEAGDEITRGKTLFEVDADPVTLMYGSTPAYRAMSPGMSGADVRQLEKNLDALGYDGFTVDDEYTGDTAAAVAEWQDDRGLEESGVVELGSVVFASGAVRVDGLETGEGAQVGPGGKVLTYTGTDKAVTVELETSDQRLADKGGKVEVTMPDGATAEGTIDEVSTVIEPGGEGEDAQTVIEVVVGLDGKKAEKAAEGYALAAVDVAFTSETREDVLTVPVAALLALEEGGFGVEVVKGSTSKYVPVETGLFTDGRVEVSGDGVAEGMTVGMPK